MYQLLSNESGQDILEYSLLLAGIALAGAATFLGMSQVINGLWLISNSRLASANSGS
jgi:Flp pilus assembly pilin Flp